MTKGTCIFGHQPPNIGVKTSNTGLPSLDPREDMEITNIPIQISNSKVAGLGDVCGSSNSEEINASLVEKMPMAY